MNKLKNILHQWGLLFLLIIILVVVVYYRLKIQMNIGALYDTYDFLANAAEFAGKSIGYTDIRPPFLSLLTSIIFRFEGLSIAPIFYIEALIDIMGVIGLYFFLKLRFNNLNSFLGSLLYSTFPILLTYVGVGFADLSSISISIWALYCTVLAVKKDSKYFLVSFSLALLAFLTKFNLALIIFPLLFYILISWQKIKNRRNIIFGILIAFSITIPLLMFYSIKYGHPLAPFLDFYGTSSGSYVGESYFDYNPDPYFYVKLLPLLIGNGALLVIFTIIGGLILGYIKLLLGKSSLPTFKFNLKENYILKISLIVLFVAFLVSWGRVSYIFSELMFFFILLGLYKLLKNYKKIDLDFLFLSWFSTYLIFMSAYVIKDIRYILMILPSFTYFLIRFLEIAENQVGLIKNRKLTFYLAPLLVLVILVSTAFYLPTIQDGNVYYQTLNINMKEASDWLVSYDPDYKSKIIYSDIWPHSGWFLQMNIGKMPEFKGNEKHYLNIKNYTPTKDDSIAANNFLVENNVYYYFSIRKWINLDNYTPINKFGIVTIYKKTF
ncbi:MAG: glycosyltransferase family 39 protein [Methanobacterium sp.]|nr:glycosyltransferase family 39 protein [Methanobacterium sp.]